MLFLRQAGRGLVFPAVGCGKGVSPLITGERRTCLKILWLSFPSTCAFCSSVASLCRRRVQRCEMPLPNLPWESGRGQWPCVAVPKAAFRGSGLQAAAPWSASRRIVRVFPICSCAKFISLIYAAVGSSSDAPAWLSTGAKKKKKKRSRGNRSTGSRTEEWHLKPFQHFCSKCRIPD